MTETTRVILEKYQVRKTKKQKKVFAAYVEGLAADYGYSFKTEKGALGAQNLVVGDPSKAKVVYTAHYDTAPVLPFPNFITPKRISLYVLYNVAIGFMKDHQLACEVLSKVWEIIATHIDEIDTSDMKRLENFILKVVKNASLNYLNDRHIS